MMIIAVVDVIMLDPTIVITIDVIVASAAVTVIPVAPNAPSEIEMS